MKILETVQPDADGYYSGFWNDSDELYIQKANVRITRCQGSFGITDLNAAMKPGKECSLFRFDWGARQFFPPREVDQIIAAAGYDFRKILDDLYARTWVKGKWDWEPQVLAEARIEANGDDYGQLRILREERPGPRTFSPFVIPNRLTEIPKKWTVPHVLRALLNGQFKDLHCNGVYTDDYAYDAAANFQIGDFSKSAQHFAKRLMEDPSGWHSYGDEKLVHISCHSFDCNQFVPVLNPIHPDNPMPRFNPLKQPPTTAGKRRPDPLPKGTISNPSPVSHLPVLTENEAKDGFEIRFPTKPNESVLGRFRATKDLPAAQRWHWHFRQHFWYAKRNEVTRAFAESIVGQNLPPAAAPTAPIAPPPAKTIENRDGFDPAARQDAQTAQFAGGDPVPLQAEYASFPKSDWAFEVQNGDTRLGYAEWVEYKIEAATDAPAPAQSSDPKLHNIIPVAFVPEPVPSQPVAVNESVPDWRARLRPQSN